MPTKLCLFFALFLAITAHARDEDVILVIYDDTKETLVRPSDAQSDREYVAKFQELARANGLEVRRLSVTKLEDLPQVVEEKTYASDRIRGVVLLGHGNEKGLFSLNKNREYSGDEVARSLASAMKSRRLAPKLSVYAGQCDGAKRNEGARPFLLPGSFQSTMLATLRNKLKERAPTWRDPDIEVIAQKGESVPASIGDRDLIDFWTSAFQADGRREGVALRSRTGGTETKEGDSGTLVSDSFSCTNRNTAIKRWLRDMGF